MNETTITIRTTDSQYRNTNVRATVRIASVAPKVMPSGTWVARIRLERVGHPLYAYLLLEQRGRRMWPHWERAAGLSPGALTDVNSLQQLVGRTVHAMVEYVDPSTWLPKNHKSKPKPVSNDKCFYCGGPLILDKKGSCIRCGGF